MLFFVLNFNCKSILNSYDKEKAYKLGISIGGVIFFMNAEFFVAIMYASKLVYTFPFANVMLSIDAHDVKVNNAIIMYNIFFISNLVFSPICHF